MKVAAICFVLFILDSFRSVENLHSFSKYKISAADRYTSFLLPILLIIVDYIAIVSAEQVAFVIRNFLIPNGGVLHISWFNFSASPVTLG